MNKIKLFYHYPVSNLTLYDQINNWINSNSVNIISAQTTMAVDDGSIYVICTVVYSENEIKL